MVLDLTKLPLPIQLNILEKLEGHNLRMALGIFPKKYMRFLVSNSKILGKALLVGMPLSEPLETKYTENKAPEPVNSYQPFANQPFALEDLVDQVQIHPEDRPSLVQRVIHRVVNTKPELHLNEKEFFKHYCHQLSAPAVPYHLKPYSYYEDTFSSFNECSFRIEPEISLPVDGVNTDYELLYTYLKDQQPIPKKEVKSDDVGNNILDEYLKTLRGSKIESFPYSELA